MIIQRQPIKTEYKTNEIGHFKSIAAGAGAKSFKVNSAGTSTANMGLSLGANNWSTAPFRVNYDGALWATSATISGTSTFTGTIYATGGAISGDLVVSGSLYSDTGGYRTRLRDGRIDFLYNNSRKAYIMASDSGTGVQLSSTNNIYLTKDNGVPIITIGQDGAVIFASPLTSYISWGSGGRKISADGSRIIIDGDLTPDTPWGQDCGTTAYQWNNIRGGDIHASSKYTCQGTNGATFTASGIGGNKTSGTVGFVTDVRDSGGIQKKYREIKVTGGIVVGFSDESGWV